MPELSVTR